MSNHAWGLAFDLVLASGKSNNNPPDSLISKSDPNSKWLLDNEASFGLERHFRYTKSSSGTWARSDYYYEEWHVNYVAVPK